MNLNELRKLAEAATPGPWKFEKDGYVKSCVVPEIVCSPHSCLHESAKPKDHMRDLKGTAKFIAAANPQNILALIDLVDEMAEALEEAMSVRAGLINWRQKAWPGIDQRLVIDRDYPHIVTALAKYKELTNGN